MLARYEEKLEKANTIYVGIDVHLRRWHVTVRTMEAELLSSVTPGNWEALRKLLERWQGREMVVAYEAGFSGFWLHDALVSWGAECLVVPPTLIPQEAGSRVKTDRKDSSKLARLLSRGLLKRVWVPSQEERFLVGSSFLQAVNATMIAFGEMHLRLCVQPIFLLLCQRIPC